MEESSSGTVLKSIAFVIVVLAIFYYGGRRLTRMLGWGNAVRHTPIVLHADNPLFLRVSLEGEALQRAENGLKLYPGDRLVAQNGRGGLVFFDGTKLYLAEDAELLMEESVFGTDSSELSVRLQEGTVWLSTPSSTVFSGSILREFNTAYMDLRLPSEAEVLISPRSLVVYSAEGIGVQLRVRGRSNSIVVGEGQSWMLREGEEPIGDLYAYRSPWDSRALESSFLLASRLWAENLDGEVNDEELVQNQIADLLELDTPTDGMKIVDSTVEVSGRVGNIVERVRINGYLASPEGDDRAFIQEIVLSEEEEVEILVEALDSKGIVVAESRRVVYRDIAPPDPPEIIRPAQSGQTYRTQSHEIEIRGNASQDVVGITVNDYRLQLFQPGDTTWSYLASTELNNFSRGRNEYIIQALDDSGNKSATASIVILLGEGEEGVILEVSATGTTSVQARVEVEVQANLVLQENDPLEPGLLVINTPTDGEVYETSNGEFSILGSTSPRTYSIWVNGYRLRLYESGSTDWKYIASYELGTLSRGRNIYEVVARNRRGEILDRLEYEVVYRVE